jgi:hypothetical protein
MQSIIDVLQREAVNENMMKIEEKKSNIKENYKNSNIYFPALA